MNSNFFLSEDLYIILPYKANAKVYLSVSNRKMANYAFDLYNPFSKKAKLLKQLMHILCVYFNPIAKLIFSTIIEKKSIFIGYLEVKLDKKISSSVYIATAKDKVVIQLQDENGVIGYVKYPISLLGTARLLNEQKGILALSSINLVPNLLMNESYNEVPFIMLQNLEGTIGQLTKQEYSSILDAFKKKQSFKLCNHPRVLDLISKLKDFNMLDILAAFELKINVSQVEYAEVFEHGDFAPWNLIRTKTGIVPFDFEYFEEQGLEYLDEYKYHFQIESLLNKKKGWDLINAISNEIDIKEFNLLFQIFLIKEIVNKHQASEGVENEGQLLKLLQNGKA